LVAIDKEERRRELLASALSVFSEKGYHAAKVEDIVSRAGVARGTFYLYFADKRAVFEELLDSLFVRLREAIPRLDPRRPVRAQIRANIDRVLAILLAERGFARILLSHAVGVDPAFDGKLLAFYDAVAAMIERAIALGQEMGLVRACDARLTAYGLLGMVKEIVYRVAMGGWTVAPQHVASELVAASLAGLLSADDAAVDAGRARRAAREEKRNGSGRVKLAASGKRGRGA
jgi:AcrR family transcriptional regulator